jgi:transaldolase
LDTAEYDKIRELNAPGLVDGVTTNPIRAAAIRRVNHIEEAAMIGADVITAPVLRQLAKHPLTEKGLTAFLEDWSATGQKIV